MGNPLSITYLKWVMKEEIETAFEMRSSIKTFKVVFKTDKYYSIFNIVSPQFTEVPKEIK